MAAKQPEKSQIPKRYGSEQDVERIYGINRRSLQKRRLLGKWPRYYRFGRKILYDLDEIESAIRASASGGTAA